MYIVILVQCVLFGFVIGLVIGFVVVGFVGLFWLGDMLFSFMFVVVWVVFLFVWVLLLIFWMQIGEEFKVILIVIGVFFLVYMIVVLVL